MELAYAIMDTESVVITRITIVMDMVLKYTLMVRSMLGSGKKAKVDMEKESSCKQMATSMLVTLRITR